jgi:hypothetical protein
LCNFTYGNDDQSLITASHEFNATPSVIWIGERALDAADKTVDGTGEGASWFLVTIKYYLARAGGETGVIPDIAFVAVEKVWDEGLISS